MEAGHVRIDRPAIIEVDTTRQLLMAILFLEQVSPVFLTTDMPSDYLYQVESDDPVIIDTIARWEAEEEE